MKLLLTGAPGSGKTTALLKFLDQIRNKQGFVTTEILDNGIRTGFQAVASNGQQTMLASLYSGSEVRISKYGIEIQEFEKFLNLLPAIEPRHLLYIDAIDQMELCSDRFKKLTSLYLSQPNPFAGTISQAYSDKFTKEVLAREDILVITITPGAKDKINELLVSIAIGIFPFNDLKSPAQQQVLKMAREYLKNDQFTQLNILFRNTVMYTAESRVNQIDENNFIVKGNSKRHKVTMANGKWNCDCNLFNGRGMYEGKAGECSHLQAINLTRMNNGPAQ
jgi:nucleoside-triphosphatase